MLKDISAKIDFTSSQTILEFNNRKKPGKDPHYRKPISDPSSQLSDDQLEAIRLFLPFFMKQKTFLQQRYIELSMEDPEIQNSKVGALFEKVFAGNQ